MNDSAVIDKAIGDLIGELMEMLEVEMWYGCSKVFHAASDELYWNALAFTGTHLTGISLNCSSLNSFIVVQHLWIFEYDLAPGACHALCLARMTHTFT